jgi:DNA-binding response OmpR family regulator
MVNKVLVVEDDFNLGIVITDMLEAMGCTVVGPVRTVEEGLKKFTSEHIDVALLDVNLKGETSFPLARVLRASKVPYAFASGYTRLNDPEFAQDQVLLKPYFMASLQDTIVDLFMAQALQAA